MQPPISKNTSSRPPLAHKKQKKEEDEEEIVKLDDSFITEKGKKLIIHVVGIKSSAKSQKENSLKEGILTIELKNIPKFFFEPQRRLISHEKTKEIKKPNLRSNKTITKNSKSNLKVI